MFEKITSVYLRNKEDIVPCHNDLKPENILYDGDRAWFVDAEAAFPNDRYSDLAIAATFLVHHDDEEKAYLKRYFKREASEYELARFFLMRQIMHMSYFTVFMVVVSSAGKSIDLNGIIEHDFRDFHNRMWASGRGGGEINLHMTNPG